MFIERFVLGELQTNCYAVYNESNECIIIDAGDNIGIIIDFVNEKRLNVLGVLLSHGHFDHCLGAKTLQDLGYKIYIHKLDADKLYTENNLASQFNVPFQSLHADVLFEQGMLNIGSFNIQVIHTPGHSAGSVVFVIDRYVFFGDTIFENGYGRTDLYDGSSEQMRQSIKTLLPYINGNYQLFYGH